MELQTKLIITAVYLGMSILTYGGSYAYWTNEYPTLHSDENMASDRCTSLIFAIFSPFSFWVVLFGSGLFLYGFQFSGGPRKKAA